MHTLDIPVKDAWKAIKKLLEMRANETIGIAGCHTVVSDGSQCRYWSWRVQTALRGCAAETSAFLACWHAFGCLSHAQPVTSRSRKLRMTLLRCRSCTAEPSLLPQSPP